MSVKSCSLDCAASIDKFKHCVVHVQLTNVQLTWRRTVRIARAEDPRWQCCVDVEWLAVAVHCCCLALCCLSGYSKPRRCQLRSTVIVACRRRRRRWRGWQRRGRVLLVSQRRTRTGVIHSHIRPPRRISYAEVRPQNVLDEKSRRRATSRLTLQRAVSVDDLWHWWWWWWWWWRRDSRCSTTADADIAHCRIVRSSSLSSSSQRLSSLIDMTHRMTSTCNMCHHESRIPLLWVRGRHLQSSDTAPLYCLSSLRHCLQCAIINYSSTQQQNNQQLPFTEALTTRSASIYDRQMSLACQPISDNFQVPAHFQHAHRRWTCSCFSVSKLSKHTQDLDKAVCDICWTSSRSFNPFK